MRLLIPLLTVVVLVCAKAQYGQVYPGGYANPFPYYYNPYGGDYLRNFGLISSFTSVLFPTTTVTSTTTTVTTCTASVVGACGGRRRRGIIIGDDEEEKIAPSAIQQVQVTPLSELVAAESGRQIYYPAASPYGYSYYYPQQAPQPFELQSTINPHYYGPAAMPYYYPYPYAPVVPVQAAPLPADKLLWTITSTSYVTATSTYTSVPPCSSSQTAYSQCPTSG